LGGLLFLLLLLAPATKAQVVDMHVPVVQVKAAITGVTSAGIFQEAIANPAPSAIRGVW
jgi:hypothetical protein